MIKKSIITMLLLTNSIHPMDAVNKYLKDARKNCKNAQKETEKMLQSMRGDETKQIAQPTNTPSIDPFDNDALTKKTQECVVGCLKNMLDEKENSVLNVLTVNIFMQALRKNTRPDLLTTDEAILKNLAKSYLVDKNYYIPNVITEAMKKLAQQSEKTINEKKDPSNNNVPASDTIDLSKAKVSQLKMEKA